ncbi:hypothetical protein DFH09DRAFT_1204792 [Mycena vulgaris]|nr:hypothetical protein DFH09DRAFT_1204792 [Mycena vulgaris]
MRADGDVARVGGMRRAWWSVHGGGLGVEADAPCAPATGAGGVHARPWLRARSGGGAFWFLDGSERSVWMPGRCERARYPFTRRADAGAVGVVRPRRMCGGRPALAACDRAPVASGDVLRAVGIVWGFARHVRGRSDGAGCPLGVHAVSGPCVRALLRVPPMRRCWRPLASAHAGRGMVCPGTGATTRYSRPRQLACRSRLLAKTSAVSRPSRRPASSDSRSLCALLLVLLASTMSGRMIRKASQ